MRYMLVDICTNNSMQLIFDLMLKGFPRIKSATHSQSYQSHNQNYLIRLIYLITTEPIQNRRTIMSKTLNQDQTIQVTYLLKGEQECKSGRRLRLIRNICLDACKGVGQLKCDNCLKTIQEVFNENRNGNMTYSFVNFHYKLYQISAIGEGRVENGLFSDKAPHYELAKMAVDYLVMNQNSVSGAWSVSVTRKFDERRLFGLKPGWSSAMAQGHAISLLCRFYNQTQNESYFEAASKAMNVFDLDVRNGGVRAYLMNISKLAWYEEYPTQPNSLFVLNGFIYSLYGLYDFWQVCLPTAASTIPNKMAQAYKSRIKQMFDEALNTLRFSLSLFDTGTRSLYDLRHLSIVINSADTVEPNLARWDYHMLHVSQLNYLADLIKNLDDYVNHYKFFKQIAKRWDDYSKGVWFRNSQIKFL
jgi:hypothetical protein